MSDLTKLREILDNQAERGIKSGDWDRLTYIQTNNSEGIDLDIGSVCVGFRFSSEGRLLGIYNWKY